MTQMSGRSRRSFIASVAMSTIALISAAIPALAQRTDAPEAQSKTVTIFAAASLKNALDSAAADYEKKSGTKVTTSYAASSALAKQIEQAAPADIFISADLDWMKYLADKSLIKSGSQINYLGNRLVLVAPKESTSTLKIAKDFALADAIGDGKIAMADVKAVPAGKYGKAALEALGVWAAVEPKIAQSDNVRSALALVARGEAPFGIVYQTDAVAEPAVKIIDTFPEDTHAPIIYPVGITASAPNGDGAQGFVAFLKTAEGQTHFSKQGFTILP